VKRVAITIVIAIGFAAIALLAGVIGYHFLGGLPWIDAVLNASMILGGMGPVNAPTTDAGKLFASGYALFAGLVFIGVFAIVIAPFAHRVMHRFHIDEDDVDKKA
jgi:hypothetical protein